MGPAGQGKCDAARGPGEFTDTLPWVRWDEDGGAVYVIGINRVGCGNNGLTHATALIRVPVGADRVPGAPEVVVQDDHPTQPFVIHEAALLAGGDAFVLAIQGRDRNRGSALYWAPADRGFDGLVRLTAPDTPDSDAGLRVR